MKGRFFLKICGSGVIAAFCLTACAAPPSVGNAEVVSRPTRLSPDQLQRVGQRIWQNECSGTIDGLTSWNSGEDFASLGIGHFICIRSENEAPLKRASPPCSSTSSALGCNFQSGSAKEAPAHGLIALHF